MRRGGRVGRAGAGAGAGAVRGRTGGPAGDRAGYLLDNRLDGAATRLAAIADLFDPVSFRHLTATGLAAGWHCWEIGAGGPTVSAWLGRTVGPTGSVVATDVDLSRFGVPRSG